MSNTLSLEQMQKTKHFKWIISWLHKIDSGNGELHTPIQSAKVTYIQETGDQI